MRDIIFREYDIRGKVGSELTLDRVYDLGRAIAFYFVQNNPSVKVVAVGMDGRIHSPAIKDSIVQALQDSGLDVIFVGICPAPVVYFAPYKLPVDAGIMITASHNPKEYNGLKLCLGSSFLCGKGIKEIRDLLKSGKHLTTSTKGILTNVNLIDAYIDWLVDHFDHLRGMDLSVVIDCGNGTGGTVLPKLIKKMNWHNVSLLYEEVDGTYPNHEADPVIEKNMVEVKRVLAETDVEFGLGLDGDCDRMAPMTKEGYLVPGDQLLAIFSNDVIKDYPGATIVFDIKSSSGLIELLEKWGAIPCISPSGHAIVKKKMKESKALLGGELSCHFFFDDRYFGYDDGIYAAMRLFECILHSGKSLTELLSLYPKRFSSREIRIECREEVMPLIIEDLKRHFARRQDIDIITIDGIRVTMHYGWGIVRASNTQSVLCMRFESDSKQGLQQVRDDFCDALKPFFNEATLREYINK